MVHQVTQVLLVHQVLVELQEQMAPQEHQVLHKLQAHQVQVEQMVQMVHQALQVNQH